MRYNIIGKNIDVWDKTKEMVEKKMDRIAKLFPADTEATITLSLEKQVATVEVTIPMNKRYARAEVQDADMTAAMDKTVAATGRSRSLRFSFGVAITTTSSMSTIFSESLGKSSAHAVPVVRSMRAIIIFFVFICC